MATVLCFNICHTIQLHIVINNSLSVFYTHYTHTKKISSRALLFLSSSILSYQSLNPNEKVLEFKMESSFGFTKTVYSVSDASSDRQISKCCWYCAVAVVICFCFYFFNLWFFAVLVHINCFMCCFFQPFLLLLWGKSKRTTDYSPIVPIQILWTHYRT